MSSFDSEKVLKYLELSTADKDDAHATMSVPERQELTGLMKGLHDALQSICAEEFSKLNASMEK